MIKANIEIAVARAFSAIQCLGTVTGFLEKLTDLENLTELTQEQKLGLLARFEMLHGRAVSAWDSYVEAVTATEPLE